MSPSKYDHLKIIKETVAEKPQTCDECGGSIPVGSTFYREKLTDPRIRFIGKRFCVKCYMKGKPESGYF